MAFRTPEEQSSSTKNTIEGSHLKSGRDLRIGDTTNIYDFGELSRMGVVLLVGLGLLITK